MAKALVIVESPTKVKTINKILGRKFKVLSSKGHLIDLPRSTFGVNIENNFEPKFIIVRSKQKILKQLKKEAENKKEIYIATDPDREGEAIGWHIVNEIGEGKKIFRVTFHEITKDAVLKAFEHPEQFDRKKIDSQIARRILDRLVGYQLSPLLWKKVGAGLSAGRVQSVALRLIVERERDIQNFIPQEYWQVAVDLKKANADDVVKASLEKINGDKFEIKNEQEAQNIVDEIKSEQYAVSNVTQRDIRRNPPAPFITSSLQQEAFNKLGFNASRTMMVAQELYEGVEVEDETVGLITYMRTDSVNIANEAIEKVRGYIKKRFGKDYLPETPNVYKSKKSAQQAHEAIRPTDVSKDPKRIAKYLDENQRKLYELVWNRFVACQMTPAVFDSRKLEVTGGKFQLGVSGSTLKFDGYLIVHRDAEEEKTQTDFSHFTIGDKLQLQEIYPTQHFTKPPPRYSEGTLVKTLEEDGIGRPSTYAPIIQTLVNRNYVYRERGYFRASDLGILISDLLVEYFPKIMDIGFTATMEEDLDLIEEGRMKYKELLNQFYPPFKEELDYAMANIEKTQSLIDRKCPKCGLNLTVKWGRNGRFLSCSGFPKCKHSESYRTGVKCPEENCEGELVERRSRRGTIFYGCSRYPECKFIANRLPAEDEGSKSS